MTVEIKFPDFIIEHTEYEEVSVTADLNIGVLFESYCIDVETYKIKINIEHLSFTEIVATILTDFHLWYSNRDTWFRSRKVLDQVYREKFFKLRDTWEGE